MAIEIRPESTSHVAAKDWTQRSKFLLHFRVYNEIRFPDRNFPKDLIQTPNKRVTSGPAYNLQMVYVELHSLSSIPW